ncbi:MAG: branched-chain amino acid transport system II carrier protein [Terrisporobacter sp.]|uniref:branched-chain amino acid transport system II carrier protein n=1 Tax=Terrisporobacter sp. TaxID=1965305 RepID=UPI002FC66E62
MRKTNKDIIVTGFALFAMFFGAGNLIFPPFLGLITGTSWQTAFSGFVLADVGISLLAILAVAKCNGQVNKVFSRSGEKFGLILTCAIMICIGPLLAIPRTAATTFEMGVQPLVGGFSSILFSIIFFGMTILLTIKPSKVVDIIGSYLTPALLVALLLLIGMGIVNPLGEIAPPVIEGVFSEGIFQGYQTLDALGAVSLSAVIIASIAAKGYTKQEEKVKLTFKAGIVAGVGLIIVYGGLAYLGATVSTMFDSNVSQAGLIVSITEMLLGYPGKVVLAIIVMLACLTTSIGLTSAFASYFASFSKGKVKYETIVIGVCVFSTIISNFGVSTIIQFSAPILSLVYPPTIALIVLTLFSKSIKNNNVFRFSAYAALFISLLNVIVSFGDKVPFIKTLPLSFLDKLPLASVGFNWVVPALIAAAIGFVVKTRNSEYKGESDEESA